MLVQVPVEKLIAALARYPDALIEFNRQLASRLGAAWEDAAELTFHDTNARLINMLLRFSRSAASTQHDDGVVLNITHSQLAQAVGAARETISLALTQLRQQNLVRTGRTVFQQCSHHLGIGACHGIGRQFAALQFVGAGRIQRQQLGAQLGAKRLMAVRTECDRRALRRPKIDQHAIDAVERRARHQADVQRHSTRRLIRRDRVRRPAFRPRRA